MIQTVFVCTDCGNETMNQKNILDWYAIFLDCREDTEDDPWPRPSLTV